MNHDLKFDPSDRAISDPSFGHGNPFAQQRLERLRFRFPDGGDWNSNWARLGRLNYRAAIVGEYGTGKSTLLREIQQRLSGIEVARPITEPLPIANVVSSQFHGVAKKTLLLDVPRVKSTCGWRSSDRACSRWQQRSVLAKRLHQLDSGTLLLVDGIERLTWLDRQRLAHMTASSSRVAGLIVIVHHRRNWLRLPAWIETQPTKNLLAELVDELIEDPLAVNRTHVQERAAEIFQWRHSNVRATLRHLYDEWPRLNR